MKVSMLESWRHFAMMLARESRELDESLGTLYTDKQDRSVLLLLLLPCKKCDL